MYSTFDSTVAARWIRDLVGRGPGQRSHWRTKTAYYRAVAGLLCGESARRLRWSTVVDAVPGGSRSTFYDVTGQNAAHGLIAEYAAAGGVDAIQIALCYQRPNAVEQLIDETKVWSYWPFRTRWLAHCRADPGLDVFAIATSLESVVTKWAGSNPGLAAAVDHAPPACAVEDMALVRQGKLPAIRAWQALIPVVAEAITGGVADPGLLPRQRGHRHNSGVSPLTRGNVAHRSERVDIYNGEPSIARSDQVVPA